MKISPLVELVPPQRDCPRHEWRIEGAGDDVVEETFTCVRCGARWQRTIHFDDGNPPNGQGGSPAWPTWDEIITQP